MFKLENNKLLVEVAAKGAEIKRVYHKENEKEMMWSGDASFWGRVSPVLFPIVGRVAGDTYLVDGQEYSLSQHGFARDAEFVLENQTESALWFVLKSNAESLKRYPFEFSLRIGYVLEDATVSVKWEVNNMSQGEMPFSIGAHPAFSTALESEDVLSDYYLHLETLEKVETYLFDNDHGLIRLEKEVIMPDLKLIPLSVDLFEEYPTLILEGETGIALKSYNHDHGVEVKFEGFPYVGIWSPVGKSGEAAPFVCVEPWYGLADTQNRPGELKEKLGIVQLAAGERFEAGYSMIFK